MRVPSVLLYVLRRDPTADSKVDVPTCYPFLRVVSSPRASRPSSLTGESSGSTDPPKTTCPPFSLPKGDSSTFVGVE